MISIGLVGTSGYSEGNFLNNLKDHPQGRITAICGRNPEHTREIADKWQIPHVFTDYNALIDSGLVQALIVATPNDSHYPITMKALEAGLHVVCDKPIGMNYGEAKRMADLAAEKGVIQYVPFAWIFWPYARYIKELMDGGYIGKPYHLNMRWYASFMRGHDYMWRMDKAKAGSGVVNDFGSHYLYMATWLFGKITSVSCQLGTFGRHPRLNPDGKPFERTDDNAALLLEFENGARGVMHLSMMTYEGTSFPMSQQMEFHGSEGTLTTLTDFDRVQRVCGAREGEGPVRELTIPDHIWGTVGHDTVMETMNDLGRQDAFMIRRFVTGVANNTPLKPDLQDGADIQRVVDAAIKSHQERCWVDVADIQ